MRSLRRGAMLAVIGLTITTIAMPSNKPVQAQEGSYESTRAAMRGVFLTLSRAYRYSVDPDAFQNAKNHDEIHNALRALVNNADGMEAHISELDASFDYLKRSLARDAAEALTRFESGQYVGARWMLNKVTENCVTCHSKLSSDLAPNLTEEFLSDTNIQSLDPLIRAELAIATRQFDTALDQYESIFAASDMSPRTIWITGALENYVRVSCGVRENPERAIRTLSKFAARSDTPTNVKNVMREWIRSLGNFDLSKSAGKELTTATDIIAKARANARFPKDRSQQVEFFYAASLLHRYLQSNPEDKTGVANALYLLGVAESFISRSYWISETDHLLEQAIRQAPDSEVAQEAYDFLEEYLLSGRAMTARDVPVDVQKLLKELRTLMEGESEENLGRG